MSEFYYPVCKTKSEFERDWKIDNYHGNPQSYGYHDGWDINLKTGGNTDLGKKIFATLKFTRKYYHYNSHLTSGFGRHALLEVVAPFNGQTYWLHYAHMKEDSPEPSEGLAGDIVGFIGQTGRPRGSMYAHLHFSIFKKLPPKLDMIATSKALLDEYWVDPTWFFQQLENYTEPEPTPEPENDILEFLNAGNSDEAKKKLIEHLGQDDNQHCNWGSDQGAGWLGQEREKNRVLTEENNKLGEEASSLRGENTSLKTSYSDLQKKTDGFKSQLAQKIGTSNDESSIIGEVERLITSESDGVKKAKDLQKAMDDREAGYKDEIQTLRSEIESQNQKLEQMIAQNKNLIQRVEDLEAQKETTKRINLVIADIINFFKKGK